MSVLLDEFRGMRCDRKPFQETHEGSNTLEVSDLKRREGLPQKLGNTYLVSKSPHSQR